MSPRWAAWLLSSSRVSGTSNIITGSSYEYRRIFRHASSTITGLTLWPNVDELQCFERNVFYWLLPHNAGIADGFLLKHNGGQAVMVPCLTTRKVTSGHQVSNVNDSVRLQLSDIQMSNGA